MKTIKNRITKVLITVVLLATVFVKQSCKKVDNFSKTENSKQTIEQKFFNGSENGNDASKRIAEKFRELKKNDENYIVEFVAKYGYPRWDKIQIIKSSTSNRNTNNETEEALLPVVEEESVNVKTCIKAEIAQAITNINTYELSYYENLPNANQTININAAERWVAEFMIQTKIVFGTNSFGILDKRLFNNLPINISNLPKSFNIKPTANPNDPSARYFCIETVYTIATGTANCNTPNALTCVNGCDALSNDGCPSGTCTLNYTTVTSNSCTYLGSGVGGGNGGSNFGSGSGFTGYTGGGVSSGGSGGTGSGWGVGTNLPWTALDDEEYIDVDGYKKPFKASNFRYNLGIRSGLTGQPSTMNAHHVFPQAFIQKFTNAGIDIHDPNFGAWWASPSHQQQSAAYNQKWQAWFDDPINANPTAAQIKAKGKDFMAFFGFPASSLYY
jgi:hypothetical protein